MPSAAAPLIVPLATGLPVSAMSTITKPTRMKPTLIKKTSTRQKNSWLDARRLRVTTACSSASSTTSSPSS